jgi:hypothetical protein
MANGNQLPEGFVLDAPQALPEGFVLDAPEQETSIGEDIVGAGETALTFATGSIAEPLAGLAGIGEGIENILSGDADTLSDMANRIEHVRSALTFQPKTKSGKDILSTVIKPFEFLAEKTEQAGMATLEATGSPELATLVQSGLEIAPMLIGVKKPKKSFKERREDVAKVEKSAERVDVDLEKGAAIQQEQIAKAAETQTGQLASKAQGIESVVDEIKRLRDISRQNTSALYDQARSTKAGIKTEQAQGFLPVVEESLRSYDVADMPIVQKRISELREIGSLPQGSVIMLEKIDNWRKRLNTNKPSATDLSQHKALGIIKGQLDDFLDAQFNSDMISGDPAAIAKWKKARGAHQRYREKFTDNKIIKKLSEQDATPEEVRAWIFGASATGAKKEAGNTIRRIKEIVGEDSTQMSSLRQNALLDIMEPLLREEPNLSAFKKNYEKLVVNNKTLADQLFPKSKSALKDLHDISKGVSVRPLARKMVDLNRLGAVAIFGHAIAKAGLKVNLAKKAFGMIRAVSGKSAKNQIMAEILGYNPGASLLPKSPIVIGGAIQTGLDESIRERINNAALEDIQQTQEVEQ